MTRLLLLLPLLAAVGCVPTSAENVKACAESCAALGAGVTAEADSGLVYGGYWQCHCEVREPKP